MSARYAIAVHRIKDAERSQDSIEQIFWATNETTSILKEGDPAIIDVPILWAGLAMAQRAQQEIATAFETGERFGRGRRSSSLYTNEGPSKCLRQPCQYAIEEDPDDAVQWHQLGLHNPCTTKLKRQSRKIQMMQCNGINLVYTCVLTQFKSSVKFLKAAVAISKECSYAWSNLGIALQLYDDPASAEKVYRRALSLATTQQAHAILSNLGNLYRQQKRFEQAKTIFAKSLELCPGYAPSHNNFGLVFVAEGRWEEAGNCFEKALQSNPFLDAAKSNLMKAATYV